MSAQPMQPAKHYARMICKFMKDLPNKYADDPQSVRRALGLSDTEFKLGLDLCVRRGVIELEAKAGEETTSDTSAGGEKSSEKKPESRSASPFSLDDDDDLVETPSPDEDEVAAY